MHNIQQEIIARFIGETLQISTPGNKIPIIKSLHFY